MGATLGLAGDRIRPALRFGVDDVRALAHDLAPHIVRTPIIGGMKDERAQPSGSYALRGAVARLLRATGSERERGFAISCVDDVVARAFEVAADATRVSAIFELYFGLELILSGRLVPMTLMPPWVQNLSNYLPFKWTFYFPIDALVGSMSARELWTGVGMQVLWIVIGASLLNLVWRAAIKQYSAVGG